MQPETRYAKSGDVHIAYQKFGEGSVNLVIFPFFVSNVEHFWEDPDIARWLLRVGTFANVVMFDKRGTGMSDRVSEAPGMDQRMDDLRAVMDAAGFDKAALLGLSEGGPLSCLFAATYPDRCQGLILYGSFAEFKSWFPSEEALAGFLGYVENHWGSGGALPIFVPSRANDPASQQFFARFERLGGSPASVIAYMRLNSQIDVRDILPTIRVPTLVIHRTGDMTINVEGGRYLATHIPGARFVELPGSDHPPMLGENANEIADLVEEFLTGTKGHVEIDRVLATVLFTDIVGSTEKAVALGDSRWRDLLDRHHKIVQKNLARFRGTEIKSTGDGMLATFDGPARAVRCARAIVDEVGQLGIEIRAGLHTGECEMMGHDIGGIAVHIGARVAALAGASEVLVSSTVKDLVAGSGMQFSDRGLHVLKGVPGDWRIYAVE